MDTIQKFIQPNLLIDAQDIILISLNEKSTFCTNKKIKNKPIFIA